MASATHPDFERPPVVETVLGVQFQPLSKLRNAHLGAFWKSLGQDWPDVRDVHRIEPQFEQFGDAHQAWGGASIQLRLTQDPSCRLQMRNTAGDRMIQVQNGRLHYNWLLDPSKGSYPRYRKATRPEFNKVLQDFKEFLAREKLGDIEPNQWEITYVNHMPQGTVWQEPADWASVLPGLLGRPEEVKAVRFGSCGGEWHFEIGEHQGRLHVQLQHGRGELEGPDERLVLKLTARGPLGEGAPVLEKGLDLGHDAIVQSFVEITSTEAQQYWGRTDVND